MPTTFSDWFTNYLLNPVYYYNGLVEYATRCFIPIMAFKLGRRQFGWTGGLICLVGAVCFTKVIADKLVNGVLNAVDWHWTQLKILISHF